MRVLAITNLFPNSVRPLLAPYNLQQLKALSEFCDVDIMATIPWFPAAKLFSRWSTSGTTLDLPREEMYEGLWVKRPRTLYVPKMLGLSGPLFAASLFPKVLRYRGQVDVIFSAWAYPDGCASVALGHLLGVPTVVKLHGSDVNVLAERPGARPYMKMLLPRAARIVPVSRALGQRMVELGVPPDRVAVVYNGVDSDLFYVRDRAEARAALGLPLDHKIILYVGNVLDTKGVLDLATAFETVAARQPNTTLVIVGNGAARPACEDVAQRVGPQMMVVGGKPFAEIGAWIAACDVLTLPSWAEGTPNVILEAYACGRRVVASDVGGIPDLIDSDVLGEMVPIKQPDKLADALCRATERDYDPADIARLGARGNWQENGARLYEVLTAAVSSNS